MNKAVSMLLRRILIQRVAPFRIGSFIGFVLLLFSLHHAGATETKALRDAVFIPQWVPQAQFAGYYVAEARGIYKKYGIDLTILTGGPTRDPFDLLSTGEADFASMWLSSGIKERAGGAKIVNIGQVVQRSALMLVAKKSSGIAAPRDMDGKKVGLWGPLFQVQPKAFFKKYNLAVKVVPQSYSVNLFLRGGVDVASAMWYNEYHTILSSGLNPDELAAFFFQDYGLNFPEDGIYTREKIYEKAPDLCGDFVQASLEGWRLAFEDPDAALDIVMYHLKEAHIPATRTHQRWMLSRMKDLILTGDPEHPMGKLLREDYDRVTETLQMQGLIERAPDYKDFYRECTTYATK